MIEVGHITAVTQQIGPLLTVIGSLIAVLLVAAIVILKLRGTMLTKGSEAAHQEGLLDGLRRMRDAGEISKEEYDAARRSLAARAAGKPRPRTGPGTPSRPGETRAPAGYDLTGAPLPQPDQPAQGDG